MPCIYRCKLTHTQTRISKKRIFRPCHGDQSLLIIPQSLFQCLSAGLWYCQQAFQHFKEQLLAHLSPLHPSAIPGELCIFGLHLTCANQAAAAACRFYSSATESALIYGWFYFWSLPVTDISLPGYLSYAKREPSSEPSASMISDSVSEAGCEWELSRKCRSFQSCQSVIITLWFAN